MYSAKKVITLIRAAPNLTKAISTDVIAAKSIAGDKLDIMAATFMEFPIFKLLNVPPLFDHVLVYGGYFESKMATTRYDRGIDSDPDDFLVPYQKTRGTFSQIKVVFNERRIEGYLQYNSGSSSLIKVFDEDGNEFTDVDTSESDWNQYSIGVMLDLTDSRNDPRQGIRFGMEREFPYNNDEDESDYFVTDIDLNFFIPFFQKDTLVFNMYHSYATVTREGLVDLDQLRVEKGLGCFPAMPQYDLCYAAETKQIMPIWASNKYGTASSLGGANRLRAYSSGRYRAGNSAFYGMEYRYNFSAEEKDVNLFFLGGIKTLFQLAAFWEAGTVNDDPDLLHENLKTSYGAGFRAIISGLIYRLDIANGDEGPGVTLFIDYPFEINPITG